jgi:hypothetical protein
MAARLKIFAARIGFFDTVVAAPSQKAALAAWGVSQDLFKEGLAAVADDPGSAAALDHPGIVLRRTAGSSDAFSVEAAIRGDAIAPASPKRPARSSPARQSPKPPDRTALDRAEAALAAALREREAAIDELGQRRRELERAEAEAAEAFERRERRLRSALDMARADYIKAGGR